MNRSNHIIDVRTSELQEVAYRDTETRSYVYKRPHQTYPMEFISFVLVAHSSPDAQGG
jgi:hypothetical protein